MASYQAILEELCRRTAASESSESLRKILETCEATGIATATCAAVKKSDIQSQSQNQQSDLTPQTLPFRPGGLTDILVERLLIVNPNENENNDDTAVTLTVAVTPATTVPTITGAEAMDVARGLVECLPDVYLPAMATSVSDVVVSGCNEISIRKTQGLLRLWVSLITHSPLGVHELLTDALISILRRNHEHVKAEERSSGDIAGYSACAASDDIRDAAHYLVEDWKVHLACSNSSDAVRCAVVLVKLASRLPAGVGLAAAKSLGATDLFVKMLGDFDDPLQQLSLLDALIEEFENQRSSPQHKCNPVPSSTTDKWLESPEIMSLVLQFLEDPLLSDASLRYVGALSFLKPNELATILDHVKKVSSENGVPTRDTERLPLVRALSTAATSSEAALSTILSDPLLRLSWWDTERIAQPKLKAAILVSVAQVLPAIEEYFGSNRALELYRLLGDDHNRGSGDFSTTTTTQWLVGKMARSPVVEVKIASLALLAAALRIGGAPIAIVGVSDRSSHSSLLELLLSPQREPTVHAQIARYDLLSAFLEALETHSSLEENPTTLKKLREKIALGPHGQKPLMHGADEMPTA
jgi:hypothetical protein